MPGKQAPDRSGRPMEAVGDGFDGEVAGGDVLPARRHRILLAGPVAVMLARLALGQDVPFLWRQRLRASMFRRSTVSASGRTRAVCVLRPASSARTMEAEKRRSGRSCRKS